MPSSETASKIWRLKFLNVLQGLPDAPILLSAGMDSGTILAGSLALGRLPACYTFHVGESDSVDSGLAVKMCEHYGLALTNVSIPRNQVQLVADIILIMRRFDTRRKTAIQCAQPLIHMGRALAADGFDKAYCGTGGVVEDNRKCAVLLHQYGEGAARRYRASSLVARGAEGSATRFMHLAIESEGVELLEPFVADGWREYSLNLPMAVINYPKIKGIAALAFPEFWLENNWYRINSPMQVNSGLREWHDTLIQSEYNHRRSKSVIGVYNDLFRDLAADNGQ